jgi:hypothetical protein
MRIPILHKDYLLVLKQISQDGEEDLINLEETLRFDQGKLKHIIQALQHKGLVKVKSISNYDIWLTLSTKGRRLMECMSMDLTSKASFS